VREIIRISTVKHPDGAAIFREASARLDEHLAADPGQAVDPTDIIDALCDEFGIEIDFAQLPDALLYAFSGPPPDCDIDQDFDPDPHATYPP
jgi:hypothetical protein